MPSLKGENTGTFVLHPLCNFFSFKKFYLGIYVYRCFDCMHVCAPHIFSVHGGQKSVSDSISLHSFQVELDNGLSTVLDQFLPS